MTGSTPLFAKCGVTLRNGEILPRRLLNRGNKTIWITGHSLGGALAELCAAQALFVSKIPVQGVYTFGQPRVGNNDFAAAVNAKLGSGIFRFVNITGKFTEEHERAFRERAIAILKGGVEKIEDHSMDRHYLVRLETKLPSV